MYYENTVSRNSTIYSYIAASLLILSFSSLLITRVTGASAFSFIDEIIFFGAFLLKISLKMFDGKVNYIVIYYFAAFVLITFISLAGGYSGLDGKNIISSMLFLKFFVILYLAYDINFRKISKITHILLLYCILGVAFSIVFTDFIYSMVKNTSVVNKFDTSRMVGFFLNPNRQAAISSVIFLYFFFVGKKLNYAIIALIILLLTESRSYIVLTGVIFLYFRNLNGKKLSNLFLIPLVLIFVFYLLLEFSLDDTLSKMLGTVDGDLRYIRIAMFFGGITLATKFFPVGAGGGQFGSPLSPGSQSYVDLGISHWRTVQEASGIHDSGLGSILGEYGFIGFFVLFVVIYYSIKLWARGAINKSHIFFIIGIILFQSMFRQVISDFYYSIISISYLIIMYFIVLNNKKIQPA